VHREGKGGRRGEGNSCQSIPGSTHRELTSTSNDGYVVGRSGLLLCSPASFEIYFIYEKMAKYSAFTLHQRTNAIYITLNFTGYVFFNVFYLSAPCKTERSTGHLPLFYVDRTLSFNESVHDTVGYLVNIILTIEMCYVKIALFLCFLMLPHKSELSGRATPCTSEITEKNDFVTATKLGTTNEFFVA